MPIKRNRIDESRTILKEAFMFALGAYTEQEAKKFDEWRDKDFFQHVAHLKHEVFELKDSEDRLKQIHNACDAVMLATILLASLLIEEKILEG